MPVLRAASARLAPSRTSAIAKSRRACSGVTAALASARSSAALWSVRTATVIRASSLSAATDSIPQQNREITNELATWTLGISGLIDRYGKAARENSKTTTSNLDELLVDLRKASNVRNVLCHASWRKPDKNGRSLPLFVNRAGRSVRNTYRLAFLVQVQQHATELACAVINTVTHMGYQFPGSKGPGNPILQSKREE